MKLIRNATTLKALPVGAIVADHADTCWEKLPNGRWQLEDEDLRGEGSESLMEVFGPFEVAWQPESDPAAEQADATRDMDRAEQLLERGL